MSRFEGFRDSDPSADDVVVALAAMSEDTPDEISDEPEEPREPLAKRCSHAELHWLITPGAQCRFCGGWA